MKKLLVLMLLALLMFCSKVPNGGGIIRSMYYHDNEVLGGWLYDRTYYIEVMDLEGEYHIYKVSEGFYKTHEPGMYVKFVPNGIL